MTGSSVVRGTAWARLLLLVSFCFWGCGGQADSGRGSETNWLSRCGQDSDCLSGSCLCGVCTLDCNADSDCAAVDEEARCIDTAELACGQSSVQTLCATPDTEFESPAPTDAGTSQSSDASRNSSDAAGSTTTSASLGAVDASSGAPSDDGETDSTGNDSSTDAAAPSPQELSPTKLDLLLVVDNSRGMADKQNLFAAALPELLQQLTNPPCVSDQGDSVAVESAEQACPAGYQRARLPLSDIHVGVITTSLGGYGAELDCRQSSSPNSEQNVDLGVLLGSLPRGAAQAPSAASAGFLSWNGTSELNIQLFSLVMAAGEFGCGFESSLEAWYRFLVDPFPYTEITRQPCNANDSANSCVGPATLAEGQLVNTQLLAQRAQFMRADSLLAIVMLSDENDCSFRASGQSWRLAQTLSTGTGGALESYEAFRGAAACNDPAYGPNHQCCQSCGAAAVTAGCPTTTDNEGSVVAAGCEVRKFEALDPEDPPNLRCFEQKRRFGVDYLYPVERYSAALKNPNICPYSDLLDAQSCEDLGAPTVPNPIYADLAFAGDSGATPKAPRPSDWIVLAGVVGVPWQDLAVSVAPETSLEYRVADPDAPAAERVDWDWVIGERYPADNIPKPADMAMRESIEARVGATPAVGGELAPSDAAPGASPINGHEWDIPERSDLQFACTFALPEPRECPSPEVRSELLSQGVAVPECACTDDGLAGSPLCQSPEGEYGLTQYAAGARPGLRQLQVLHDLGEAAVVTSICAKSTDRESSDYGYRPVTRALLQRFEQILKP